MDSESTRLLWDLRAALLKAMSESQDMRLALDRLRECGWSAYVVINESRDEPEAAAEPLLLPGGPTQGVLELDGADLSFLRALGIDPDSGPHGV